MARYWSRSVIYQDGVEVHRYAETKNEANIQPSLPNNAGSIKASLITICRVRTKS